MYADGSNGTTNGASYPCDPCDPYYYACCPVYTTGENGSTEVVYYPCYPCGYYPCDPCSCNYDVPCIQEGTDTGTDGSQGDGFAEPLVDCYPCPVYPTATEDGTSTEGTVETEVIVCPM